MMTLDDYKKSAEYIKTASGGKSPEVLIILGSGLGYLADMVTDAVSIPYGDIPNFRVSTAPGHEGRLVLGKLAGRQVCVMQGRLHIYEGWTAEEVVYPVRVARLLGVDKMIVTNACGGINLDYKPGDLVVISDQIKLFDVSPLAGKNIEEFGVRFPDMSCYTKEYRDLAKKAADKLGITLREGVYIYFPGPQYETPAEIRAARILGADVVGMSTVPEVIAARHCGMKILGVSLVANMAAGVLDRELTEEEVITAAKEASDRFGRLVVECLEKM